MRPSDQRRSHPRSAGTRSSTSSSLRTGCSVPNARTDALTTPSAKRYGITDRHVGHVDRPQFTPALRVAGGRLRASYGRCQLAAVTARRGHLCTARHQHGDAEVSVGNRHLCELDCNPICRGRCNRCRPYRGESASSVRVRGTGETTSPRRSSPINAALLALRFGADCTVSPWRLDVAAGSLPDATRRRTSVTPTTAAGGSQW